MLTDLKNRFQFVIGLVLFFPVILDALNKASQVSDISSSETVLKYTSAIASILTAYLMLEILGEKVWTWLKKTLNYLLMVEMALFVSTFYFLASSVGKAVESISWWTMWTYKVDFFSLLLIPIVIFVLLASNLVYSIVRAIKLL